ncbi:VTC domain-containing protein [Candidatus Pelagibacter sp.]|nr:VTC domain-containing protein [Candidatus Pelagibacter sp.]
MNDLRIEKKFIFGKKKEENLKKLLIINGFTQLYQPRKISSVYLDTLNFDFAKDNINGVSKRKKIRFRWYDNNLTNIYLEEKNKQNFQVNKNVNKIYANVNKESIISDLKKYFYSPKNRFNSFNYKFILKINYSRSYWISNNKKFRATIDHDLKINPINNLFFNLDLNETILEFKFPQKYEASFREFIHNKDLQIRAKKFSKYIQSFFLLENSGFID